MDVTSYLLGKSRGGGGTGGGFTPDIAIYQSSLTYAHLTGTDTASLNELKAEIIRILNKAYSDGVENLLITLSVKNNVYLYCNNLDIKTKPTTAVKDFWAFTVDGTGNFIDNEMNKISLPALYSYMLRISDIVWDGDTITNLTVNYRHGSYLNVLSTTNTATYTPSANYHPATKKYVDEVWKSTTGYDAAKTQVLKNVQGTLTWVDE